MTRAAPRAQVPPRAEIEAELLRRSLRRYIRAVWHVVEPATPFVPGWHIDALADHLEAVTRGEIRRLVVNIPPRCMKSLTAMVFWPTWAWLARPHLRWLTASYASELAIRDAVKSRRILASPFYQRLNRKPDGAPIFQLAGDQNTKHRYENDHTGHRIAVGVDGMGTGEGGDVVAVDDPHNVRKALSDVQRDACLTWWDQTMSTRLNSPATGALVIVMQRLHERDLAGHVLAQATGYDHLLIRNEWEAEDAKRATSIGWKDPRAAPGDLMWPERQDASVTATLKRALGSYGYAAQEQQRPVPASGGVFRRSWFKYYRAFPPKWDRLMLSWDCAFKAEDDSSYVVGQVWGQAGPEVYLLAQVREHLDFPATCDAIRLQAAAWPRAREKLIEDKANGPAVIASLAKKLPGIVPVSPEGSKLARAHAVSPYVEAGNVYLPDPETFPDLATTVADFLAEVCAFPRAEHDDQVDAMTQALRRIYLPDADGDVVEGARLTRALARL